MNRSHVSKLRASRYLVIAIALLLLSVFVLNLVKQTTYGINPGRRALYMSTNETGATAEYQLAFVPNVTGPVGSIEFEFCANDPLPGTPCTPPPGFDVSSAVLTSQIGQTGFSINGTLSTTNKIVISRTPAVTTAGVNTSYNFTGIVNPNVAGAYYARLQAFPNSNATGSVSDYGGIAFNITNLLSITATVPPFLTFCTGITISGLNCATANGNYIDFGELSSNSTRSGTSQMLAATNAQDGYNVTLLGTTLSSGNNAINELNSGDVSRPGTAQFGLNLTANSSPGVGNNPIGPGVSGVLTNYAQPNFFKFSSGETIISYPDPDDVRQYTASYIVNVPNNQEAGIYVSTVTYICLATF